MALDQSNDQSTDTKNTTIFSGGQNVPTVIDLTIMSGVCYLSAEEGHVYFHMTNGDIIDYPYPDINYTQDIWISEIDKESGGTVWVHQTIYEPVIDNNGQPVLYVTRPTRPVDMAQEMPLRAANRGINISRVPQRIPLYPFTPQGSSNEVTESLFNHGGLKGLFAIPRSRIM